MLPGEIVKQGSWLYAGTHKSAIRIVRGDVFYGTGDYEDPPEVSDDRDVECFSVQYESPPASGKFPGRNGQFLSLAEAVEQVERLLGKSVRWDDDNCRLG